MTNSRKEQIELAIKAMKSQPKSIEMVRAMVRLLVVIGLALILTTVFLISCNIPQIIADYFGSEEAGAIGSLLSMSPALAGGICLASAVGCYMVIRKVRE